MWGARAHDRHAITCTAWRTNVRSHLYMYVGSSGGLLGCGLWLVAPLQHCLRSVVAGCRQAGRAVDGGRQSLSTGSRR